MAAGGNVIESRGCPGRRHGYLATSPTRGHMLHGDTTLSNASITPATSAATDLPLVVTLLLVLVAMAVSGAVLLTMVQAITVG